MPVDYSKWDALELSDDSDVEVHPNVDKRSFIRAKQNQIHMEREQRKNQIEVHKYEYTINAELLKRLDEIRTTFDPRKAALESGGQEPIEMAMQASIRLMSKNYGEQPPPPPKCLEKSESLPSYGKMVMQVFDKIQGDVKARSVDKQDIPRAFRAELDVHIAELEKEQVETTKKIEKLESIDKKKITSESYHTGFDSSHVNKSQPKTDDKGKGKATETTAELLNPGFGQKPSGSEGATAPDEDDIESAQASPDALKFAQIKIGNYAESLSFISNNRHLLSEKETDGLLVQAFDAALEGKHDYSLQCVHQALLLQYCRSLGADGVALFFKRVSAPGKARDLFTNDVRDTHEKIKKRAGEIAQQRAAEGGAGDGVEQIQLHAVEPGTTITIRIPEENATTEDGRKARAIYDKFDSDMKRALESGLLEEVNKVLGAMACEDAEELVGLLGEAGCLSVEEKLIDATTEEGKKALKEMEEKAKAESEEMARAQAAAEAAGHETAADAPAAPEAK